LSRETEKVFKEFHKYTGNKVFENEDEVNKAMSEFLEKYNAGLISKNNPSKMDADDYLDMAYDAETPEESLKYAKKALKEDRNCLDAKLLIIQSEGINETTKKQLEDVIKGETKRLEKEGYFDDENIGHFYGILETRPYMRIRAAYIDLLVVLSKYRKAVSECEDLIRLNENDNLGMRDNLMILYAMLEDLAGAKALCNKYKEDSLSMLYPLAVLYYRLDDYNNAIAVVRKIFKKNKDFRDFMAGKLVLSEEDTKRIISSGMYRPNTIEEVVLTFRDNSIMFDAMNSFNDWVSEECL